jgi:eukaryotic-like serine/threonine-protein kinase
MTAVGTKPDLHDVTASGRYTDLERIAVGGMAEVFRAIQHGEDGFRRTVVLKRILPAMAADPKFRNAFLDEAHIAMALHHGNVVAALDMVQANGSSFLVMDMVDGWNVAAVLRRSRSESFALPLGLALYIVAEVCRGIAYVHARKGPDGHPLCIVHRDINPQNILLSQDGEVKVTDFGIAKAIGRREQTFAGLIKGRPEFMSPEQASGAELDAASDIFSIGSVLYLLATGAAPFNGATDLETLLRVQACKFAPPEEVAPGLPAAVITIVKTAMQLDRSRRYGTANELMLAIEAELHRQGGSPGRSALQRWLAELRDRDGGLPTSEAPCLADDDSPAAESAAARPLPAYRRRVRSRRLPLALAMVCGVMAVSLSRPGGQGELEATPPPPSADDGAVAAQPGAPDPPVTMPPAVTMPTDVTAPGVVGPLSNDEADLASPAPALPATSDGAATEPTVDTSKANRRRSLRSTAGP